MLKLMLMRMLRKQYQYFLKNSTLISFEECAVFIFWCLKFYTFFKQAFYIETLLKFFLESF